MPLFDVSGDSIKPFRRLSSSADVYEHEIETLFWDDLEAFAGEPLFAVARQARLIGGGIPDILALDPSGRVVVIEIKRDVDRSQLAQCLEYAGWARQTSLDELAGLYTSGPEKFFTDWQEFTGTSTPVLLSRVPRVHLVARSFASRTESALKYLQDGGVPVKLITIVFYEDSDGNRIVDVDNGSDRAAVDPVVTPPATGSVGKGSPASPATVTLMDLLEAGLLLPDEPIEWKRPQVGEHHTAVIRGNGEVVVADGRSFNSLSTAADVLTGGNHNGWECWSVPRRGHVRIGMLRNEFSPSPSGD